MGHSGLSVWFVTLLLPTDTDNGREHGSIRRAVIEVVLRRDRKVFLKAQGVLLGKSLNERDMPRSHFTNVLEYRVKVICREADLPVCEHTECHLLGEEVDVVVPSSWDIKRSAL